MSLSKKEILESYRRAESVVKKWAENNGHVRLGSNGPSEGWYEYPKGYDGNVRRPRLLTGDYRKLSKKAAKGARSVYGSINVFDPDSGDYIQQKEHDETWKDEDEDDSNPVQGNPLPEYRDIETVTLFADVDLEGDYKPKRKEEDIKETVEKAIPIYIQELRKIAPNSVNILDSGGGFYPHIHHKVTKPISEKFEDEARGWIFEELMSRFNDRLDDISEKVEEEVMEASEILDPDTLNNKNRLMKAPLSIHRSLDIVVHPINPDDPDFDPEPAPVTKGVVEETEKWLEMRDSNLEDIETLISELWPNYEGSWKERLQQWYEGEKEKREKREKERLEHKRKMEERRGELGEKGVSIKGFPVTNCFEDILAALETIDVRDMVSSHITDKRDGRQPRFNPPWRSSETGTSCFATKGNFVDINEGNTGGGPVKFAAREHELISSCDEDLEGEKWWKALNLLRQEYGYRISILIPDVNTEMPGEDGKTYDQTPHWGIIKAGFAFGIIDEDDLVEKETKNEDGETIKRTYFPSNYNPRKYNQILRELKKRGFEHGREKKYLKKVGDKFKFSAKLLAEDILPYYNFKTTKKGDEIFVYESGVYKPEGEIIIREEAQQRLGNKSKKHWKNETVDFIADETRIPDNAFEETPHLINVKNGIYNLKKDKLEKHSPEILSTCQIPVKYDPDAECPKIMEFLHDVVSEEDVSTLIELSGYCLYTKYEIQDAFALVGGGANGKTTFVKLLRAFIGNENMSDVPLQDLDRKRFAPAQLYGKLVNAVADLPQKALKKTGVFKSLTGGDPITAEKKNKPLFEFVNYAKLIFAMNEVPTSYDDTLAFTRRWIFVDFPNKFQDEDADPKILDKMTTEEELSGFLNKALEGLKTLLDRGEFKAKLDHEEVKKRINSIYAFITEKCVQGSDEWTPKERLYNAYGEFVRDNNFQMLTKRKFNNRLRKTASVYEGRRKVNNRKKRVWNGISLKKDYGVCDICQQRDDKTKIAEHEVELDRGVAHLCDECYENEYKAHGEGGLEDWV